MSEGVSRERTYNQPYPIGTGYIVIPCDIDRDVYIEECYRKERVAVQMDDGMGILKNCFISQSAMQSVRFPESYKELGSLVVFIFDKFKSQPIILDVVSKRNETQLLQENSFKRVVTSKTGSVSIEGKAKDGNLFVNVESDFENSGNIFINLRSKNNTSKFNVNCFGDINIYSEGDTSLETLKTAKIICNYIDGKEKKLASKIELTQNGFLYEDKSENKIECTKDSINVVPKTKFNIFKGKSPLVKGDELVKELAKSKARIDGIINTLKSAPSANIAGYATAVTTGLSSITEVENFDDINSDKSFTD